MEAHLHAEVEELFALGERADMEEWPEGLVVSTEVAFRQARLARLAEARAVLEARARERDVIEAAAYEAKVRERAERANATGRRLGGKPPKPPTPGPRATDQDTFTDPESRIMKQSSSQGFEQDDHGQGVSAKILRGQAEGN